jgi:mono/diheme cytochrome c family protein
MKRFFLVGFLALFGVFLAGANAKPPAQTDLGQGWTQADRDWWYSVSQGSRLLPLSWAKALELKDSNDTFLSDSHLRHLNYLTDRNTAGLPLGFVVDTNTNARQTDAACMDYPTLCDAKDHFKKPWTALPRQPWLGLNCSACHTNDIAYKGRTVRVDGAPSLADFQSFLEDMLGALTQTDSDSAKFDRFAAAVLPKGASAADKVNLHAALHAVTDWEQRLSDKNATPLRHGDGRLDAQGHILNKVEMLVGIARPAPVPSDAPASYPFIWDAPILDRVQWNGIAKNNVVYKLPNLPTGQMFATGIGAMGRNVGEVIGVFGDVNVHDPDAIQGYKSSVKIAALIDIERKVATLRSPKWPASFPPIDKTKSALGKEIYWGKGAYADTSKGNCSSCHDDPSNTRKAIQTKMYSLADMNTDLWLACNTYTNQAKTGWLEGRRTLPFAGTRFADSTSGVSMLQNVAVETIVGGAGQIAEKALDDLFGRTPVFPQLGAGLNPIEYLPGVSDKAKKQQAERCISDSRQDDFADNGLAYKARPLNGIWATAPYLHNGSVPTLYDLLLPGTVRNSTAIPQSAGVPCADGGRKHLCTRPEDFSVGSHEFDPVKVGFVSTPNLPGTFEFHVRTAAGTPILGNYNAGHDYGEKLTDAERWALVEYLKGL